ncbi:hypothetical protein FRC98_18845 [Lujinxingia vulgaris]|uniref:Uncharacterized protein n=1 Tax=Lujinxingia vulgaris TaxID=2600176 RepID=A0A5C6WXT9_9DELT|nr:hypothetical protein FRC98_18845 [Lujinxingia vulgaris]
MDLLTTYGHQLRRHAQSAGLCRPLDERRGVGGGGVRLGGWRGGEGVGVGGGGVVCRYTH